MTQNPKQRLFTLEEYFRRERKSIERHEYFRGNIRRLSGSTPEHALVTANTLAGFGNARSIYHNPEIKVYAGDFLIEVQPEFHYTYADFTIVEGKTITRRLFGFEILTNPSLIVEVLSNRHFNYDLGTKFQLYKNIPTFRDYLLVDSRKIYVQHYQKIDSNTWQEKTYKDLDDVITIENLGFEITVSELYEGVEFEPEITII